MPRSPDQEDVLLAFTAKFDDLVRSIVDTMIETLRNIARVYVLDPNALVRSFTVPMYLSRYPKLIALGRLILWYGVVPKGTPTALSVEVLELAQTSWLRLLQSKRGEVAKMVGATTRALGMSARDTLAEISEYLANEGRHVRSGYLLAVLNTVVGV